MLETHRDGVFSFWPPMQTLKDIAFAGRFAYKELAERAACKTLPAAVLGDHVYDAAACPTHRSPLGPHVVLELVVAPREQLAQLVPRAARAMEQRHPLLPCVIDAVAQAHGRPDVDEVVDRRQ